MMRRILALVAAGAVGAAALAFAPAVQAAAPGQVTGVTVTPQATGAAVGDGRITVSWAGVAGAVGYFVNYGVIGGGTSSISVTAPADPTANVQATIDGLTGGSTYSVTVQGVNGSGRGAASNPATAVPVTVPTAPTGIEASTSGTTTTVSWTETPVNLNGGAAVTSYTVSLTNSGTGEVASSTGQTSSTATYANLANGSYQVQIRAVNSAGSSTAAISTITVSTSESGEPESEAGATTNPPTSAGGGTGSSGAGGNAPGSTSAPTSRPVATLPTKVTASAGAPSRATITVNAPLKLSSLELVVIAKSGKRTALAATFTRDSKSKIRVSYRAPGKPGSYTLVLYQKVGNKRVLVDSTRLLVKA